MKNTLNDGCARYRIWKAFEISVPFRAISTPVKLQGVIVETVILCYVVVKISLTALLNSGTHQLMCEKYP